MNPELVTVLGFAMLPALGSFGGGLLGEWLRPSQTILNRAPHAASGIILAVIAVQVMPQALLSAPAWLLALAFLAGGGAHLVMESRFSSQRESGASGPGAEAWMVYMAVASDLLGDRLLIGAGSAISSQVALLLAIAGGAG